MKINGNVWEKIKQLETPTKSEKHFIEKINEIEIEDLIYKSITELSDITCIAEATIVRFCRKLGFKGFQDFKLKLSQDLSFKSSNVDSLSQSIANNMVDAINLTASNFDIDECRKIAKLVVSARKACVFAVGNSGIAALQLQNRLLKAGIFVQTISDTHFHNVLASNMDQRDIMILISVSGSTKDIIHIADMGKSLNVPIVVITNSLKSPLSKRADYVLFSAKREAPTEGGSFAAAVAQTYIIDVLCTEIFNHLGSKGKDAETRANASVSDKLL